MDYLTTNYSHLIIFAHVISAIVWIGGMITIRIAVHPVMQHIDDKNIKLGSTLQVMAKLFHLVVPFIFILAGTGLLMSLARDGHHGTQSSTFLLKESIWTVMLVNFAYMYFKRFKAWKFFQAGDILQAKKQVVMIPNILLPINIILGIIAVWLGVELRFS